MQFTSSAGASYDFGAVIFLEQDSIDFAPVKDNKSAISLIF